MLAALYRAAGVGRKRLFAAWRRFEERPEWAWLGEWPCTLSSSVRDAAARSAQWLWRTRSLIWAKARVGAVVDACARLRDRLRACSRPLLSGSPFLSGRQSVGGSYLPLGESCFPPPSPFAGLFAGCERPIPVPLVVRVGAARVRAEAAEAELEGGRGRFDEIEGRQHELAPRGGWAGGEEQGGRVGAGTQAAQAPNAASEGALLEVEAQVVQKDGGEVAVRLLPVRGERGSNDGVQSPHAARSPAAVGEVEWGEESGEEDDSPRAAEEAEIAWPAVATPEPAATELQVSPRLQAAESGQQSPEPPVAPPALGEDAATPATAADESPRDRNLRPRETAASADASEAASAPPHPPPSGRAAQSPRRGKKGAASPPAGPAAAHHSGRRSPAKRPDSKRSPSPRLSPTTQAKRSPSKAACKVPPPAPLPVPHGHTRVAAAGSYAAKCAASKQVVNEGAWARPQPAMLVKPSVKPSVPAREDGSPRKRRPRRARFLFEAAPVTSTAALPPAELPELRFFVRSSLLSEPPDVERLPPEFWLSAPVQLPDTTSSAAACLRPVSIKVDSSTIFGYQRLPGEVSWCLGKKRAVPGFAPRIL